MKRRDEVSLKNKAIVLLSLAILLISSGIFIATNEKYDNSLVIEAIDTRSVSTTVNKTKSGEVQKLNNKIVENGLKTEEVDNSQNERAEEEQQPVVVEPPRIWYLPTNNGVVTQNPHYGHVALDITSPNGSGEVIYPVASGVISGIYRDYAGALIVTVRHLVDGRYYTSQYVHLSRYADIYVGQEVNPYTPLGWMGTTGNSSGVHLHLAVMDCNLFGGTDSCNDLNGFFNYANARVQQGWLGLGNQIVVPGEWYGRRY